MNHANWDDEHHLIHAALNTRELMRRLLKLLDTVTVNEMVNSYKPLGETE